MKNETVAVVVVIVLVLAFLAGLGSSTVLLKGRQPTTITSTSTLTAWQTSTLTTTLEQTVTSITNPEAPIPIASIETANLTIGGSFMAVDPNTTRIYVTTGSSQLTVLDALSHSVLASISLPATLANGLAVDSNWGMVYASVNGGIVEINGSTNKVVGELQYDLGPLAVDPSTHTIYGVGSNDLVEVDPRNGSVIANIPLGYWANDLSVSQARNMVYAAGCEVEGLVCNSIVSIVNDTSGKLVTQVKLGSLYYPTVTIDDNTGIVYVSGGPSQFISMTWFGSIIYNSNPQTCGPFISMSDIPPSNQVIMAPQDYNFLLFYDGSSLALVNMYSLPNSPQQVVYNPDTNEVYVLIQGDVVAFHNVASTGHVNATLIGSDVSCGLP